MYQHLNQAAARELCAAPEFGGGAARVKNGFALSEGEAGRSYHYRTLMLNLVYTAPFTYGDLAKKSKKAWDKYIEAPPGNPTEKWSRWRQHAQAAVKVLSEEKLASAPVKIICEVQMLLEPYLLARKKMHLLYKVVRSDSAELLYQQFAAPTETYKKKDTWNSVETGNRVAVLKKMEAGADAHKLLEDAIEKGQEQAALALLPSVGSSNINKYCLSGHTPLTWACVHGASVLVVKKMFELGADGSITSRCQDKSYRPLGTESRGSQTELHEQGALFWAARQGNAQLVQLLVARKIKAKNQPNNCLLQVGLSVVLYCNMNMNNIC